jgi:hypothetical protein
MSSTSQVTDFQDLYTDVLQKARENTGLSALSSIAKGYINTALQHILSMDEFEWGKRWATLITHGAYSTGTVSISQGSTALTGDGTLWNTANTFAVNNAQTIGKIKLSTEVYEISSVNSDTSITLASKYTLDDLAAGSSYEYFEDEYAVAADFEKPILTQNIQGDIQIPIISTHDFNRMYVRNDVTGDPRIATFQDRTFSGSTARVQRLVLNPAPSKAYTIRYRYVTSNIAVTTGGVEATALVNDNDEPIIPIRYREAISLYAIYLWMAYRKDDQRSQMAKAGFDEMVCIVKADYGAPQPRPRMNMTKPVPQYGSRGRGGRHGRRRFQTGSEFDEMRV